MPDSVCAFPISEHDTDSDSDLSLEDDQSGSYASTHSSDSEEDEEFTGEPCWENLLCPNNEKQPAHSTPKGSAGTGGLGGEGRVQLRGRAALGQCQCMGSLLPSCHFPLVDRNIFLFFASSSLPPP